MKLVFYYVIFATLAVRSIKNKTISNICFTAVNLWATYRLCLNFKINRGQIGVYFLLILVAYGLLANFNRKRSTVNYWLSFSFPIFVLIYAKTIGSFIAFLGISYMAFRLSYLASVVRINKVLMPNVVQYLGFAFFTPTMQLGPITRYEEHTASIDSPQPLFSQTSLTALYRIIIGLVKFQVLANIFFAFTFTGLWRANDQRTMVEFMAGFVSYYLYLYLNFSGACDIIIGISQIIGIKVKENFRYPLMATNIKDFWNRWHLSLSEYMRDIFFTPVTKFLAVKFGVKHLNNYIIPFTITLTFTILGVWHGFQWNCLIFGLLNGLGLSVHHLFTLSLKKRLSKKKLQNYYKSTVVKLCGWVLTFTYIAFVLFCFENNFKKMGEIFKSLNWY